ncbi:hypothetical protein BGX38DRAFT_554245 [Terfezia claveryi]|nr:hypothetical protein BGX38DRAFT_554245 [Terfezia claveryi]
MLSTGNFIPTPTPRSVGLLARVLSIYPTLRPILSYSHRADIIHLARTCRTLSSILRDSVSPLCTPFPRCTSALESCHWCRAIICTSCKAEVQWQQKPYLKDVTGGELHANYAMVIRTEASTKPVFDVFFRDWLYQRSYYAKQIIQTTTVCASCFSAYKAPMPTQLKAAGTRSTVVEELHWDELPNTHSMCNCTDQTKAECEGDKRFIEFKDISLSSVLWAVLKLPQELRQTHSSEFVALYID